MGNLCSVPDVQHSPRGSRYNYGANQAAGLAQPAMLAQPLSTNNPRTLRSGPLNVARESNPRNAPALGGISPTPASTATTSTGGGAGSDGGAATGGPGAVGGGGNSHLNGASSATAPPQAGGLALGQVQGMHQGQQAAPQQLVLQQQGRRPQQMQQPATHNIMGEEDNLAAADDQAVPFSWERGKLIGAGAFGRVYVCLNNGTAKMLAVKQVALTKDDALRGRVAEHVRALEQEVAVLRTLRHENIVQYLGTERTADCLNIFLEYVPGGSIASMIESFGALKENTIRIYTKQILNGLAYLHGNRLMHRDIKGANILVDKEGIIKLADFGASKKIENLATVGSGNKSIRGTPYWMAPEVIKQTGHGRPADIWSLACVVIEMATGKPPWANFQTQVAAMFHIASTKEPPPLPDSLSPEAHDFLRLCFNRVPKERPNASRLLRHPWLVGVAVPSAGPAPVMQQGMGAAGRAPPSPIKEEGMPAGTSSHSNIGAPHQQQQQPKAARQLLPQAPPLPPTSTAPQQVALQAVGQQQQAQGQQRQMDPAVRQAAHPSAPGPLTFHSKALGLPPLPPPASTQQQQLPTQMTMPWAAPPAMPAAPRIAPLQLPFLTPIPAAQPAAQQQQYDTLINPPNIGDLLATDSATQPATAASLPATAAPGATAANATAAAAVSIPVPHAPQATPPSSGWTYSPVPAKNIAPIAQTPLLFAARALVSDAPSTVAPAAASAATITTSGISSESVRSAVAPSVDALQMVHVGAGSRNEVGRPAVGPAVMAAAADLVGAADVTLALPQPAAAAAAVPTASATEFSRAALSQFYQSMNYNPMEEPSYMASPEAPILHRALAAVVEDSPPASPDQAPMQHDSMHGAQSGVMASPSSVVPSPAGAHSPPIGASLPCCGAYSPSSTTQGFRSPRLSQVKDQTALTSPGRLAYGDYEDTIAPQGQAHSPSQAPSTQRRSNGDNKAIQQNKATAASADWDDPAADDFIDDSGNSVHDEVDYGKGHITAKLVVNRAPANQQQHSSSSCSVNAGKHEQQHPNSSSAAAAADSPPLAISPLIATRSSAVAAAAAAALKSSQSPLGGGSLSHHMGGGAARLGTGGDEAVRASKMQKWREELFAELSKKREEERMQRKSMTRRT